MCTNFLQPEFSLLWNEWYALRKKFNGLFPAFFAGLNTLAATTGRLVDCCISTPHYLTTFIIIICPHIPHSIIVCIGIPVASIRSQEKSHLKSFYKESKILRSNFKQGFNLKYYSFSIYPLLSIHPGGWCFIAWCIAYSEGWGHHLQRILFV